MISRRTAYHGTTLGALNITGLDAIKEPFLPLLNGQARHVPNTNRLHCQSRRARRCTLAGADAIERRSSPRVPRRSPPCSSSRCRTPAAASCPPTGYFQRVREICDRHGVLLVTDEVICALRSARRLVRVERLGYQPDMLTFAKGVTSGYARSAA